MEMNEQNILKAIGLPFNGYRLHRFDVLITVINDDGTTCSINKVGTEALLNVMQMMMRNKGKAG